MNRYPTHFDQQQARMNAVMAAQPAMQVDICEGLDGSGNPVWLVIVTSALRTEFVHQFNNKPEAENWLKWCCQGMAQAVQS